MEFCFSNSESISQPAKIQLIKIKDVPTTKEDSGIWGNMCEELKVF